MEPMVYRLKLLLAMKKLHSVFNIVKLSTTLTDLIPGRRLEPPLPSIIIDGEEKWKIEEC